MTARKVYRTSLKEFVRKPRERRHPFPRKRRTLSSTTEIFKHCYGGEWMLYFQGERLPAKHPLVRLRQLRHENVLGKNRQSPIMALFPFAR